MDMIYMAGGAVAFVVVIGALAAFAKAKIGNMSVLILQEFNYKENEDLFLTIRGRASGFWNWVLSLFDKAPITVLSFNKRLFRFEAYKMKSSVPMVKISCVSSGMLYKSLILLRILGVLIFIGGIAVPDYIVEVPQKVAIVVLGVIIFALSFIKRKSMHISICVNENKPIMAITLKKGIINSVDHDKFEAAMKTLNKVVLANAIEK